MKLNRFDIEFYNGLMKGILACHDMLERSQTKGEAQQKIGDLLEKIKRKNDTKNKISKRVRRTESIAMSALLLPNFIENLANPVS